MRVSTYPALSWFARGYVLIAVQAAMFDHMSEGRFILGVSPGALTTDAEALGILDQDRNKMFAESIDVILAICAGALRRYLEAKQLLPDAPLVAMVPISVRTEEEKGATAVEYALMVALIAIVIVSAVAFLGNSTSSQFNHMGGCLNTPSATC